MADGLPFGQIRDAMGSRSAPHSQMRGRDRAGVAVVIGTPDHAKAPIERGQGALIRGGRQAGATASNKSPGWQSRAMQIAARVSKWMPFTLPDLRRLKDAPFLPSIRDGKLVDLLGAGALAAIQPCKGAE
jgi:hypothetical protein